MRIAFGADVSTADAESFGSVSGFVVDGTSNRVEQLLVKRGLLGGDETMVDWSGVRAAGDGALRLDVAKEAADALPGFVAIERADDPRLPEEPLIMPASGVGGPVMVEDEVPDRDYLRGGNFIDVAPIDPPVVEPETNLLDTWLVLRERTDVWSADGHKLGDLHALDVSNGGDVEQLTVRAGFIFKEDRVVAGSAIRELDSNKILLSTNRADVERAGA